MTTLRSPIALRRSSKKTSADCDGTIFLRDSSEVASSECRKDRRQGAGIFTEENLVGVNAREQKSTGKNSSPLIDHQAGRTRVQKLDENAYKPWGSRSRSSSDAGSDTSFCKGGPGKAVCGDPFRHSDSGVSCDRCDKWFHSSCQGIPKPAYDALSKYKVLSWMCVQCKETLKSHDKDESQLAALESKVESLSSTVQDQMQLGHAVLVARVEQLADTVKEHMRLVGQSLREQEQSVECQTKLIERSIRESHSQKAAYAEMVRGTCSEIVDKVSSKVSSIPQTVADCSTPKEMKSLVEAFDSYRKRG